MSSPTDDQLTRDAKNKRLAFLRAKQAGLGTTAGSSNNQAPTRASTDSMSSVGGPRHNRRTSPPPFSAALSTIASPPAKQPPRRLSFSEAASIAAAELMASSALGHLDSSAADLDAAIDELPSVEPPVEHTPLPAGPQDLMVDEDGEIMSPGSDSDDFEPTSPEPNSPDRTADVAVELRRRDLKREEKWWEMLTEWKPNTPPPSKMKSRARKGVPKCLRGQVWPRLASEYSTAPLAGRYAVLSKQVTEFEEQIRKDIGRTFPKHVWFKENLNGAGQTALLQVLRAFAAHDPELGYTQGMGFVTGQFLMHMCEESAFQLLTQVASGYGMRDIWRPGFPRLIPDLFCFEALLKNFDKELVLHMRAECMQPEFYAVEWFMTLFAAILPTKCLCRVWDMLFSEGHEKVMFRVAIALMVFARDKLIGQPFEELMNLIKKGRVFRPLTGDPDLMMEAVINVQLTTAQVARAREKYARKQEEEGK